MPTTCAASNQQKPSATLDSEASVPQAPTQPLEATAGTSKALELPMEILTEISSYFYALVIPEVTTHPNDNNDTFPQMYQPNVFERPKVLRALSQTCRLWRSMLYPLIWEHVICTPEYMHHVGRQVDRLCAFFRHRSTEASLVRALTITLPYIAHRDVNPFQEVVGLLKRLKNLHTLQISLTVTKLEAMHNALINQTFPSIQTVILPAEAYGILQSCGNVRTIICTASQHGDMEPLCEAIEKHCKAVDALGGEFSWECVQWIARVLPDLQSIMIPAPVIHKSWLMRNLCYIELNVQTVLDPATTPFTSFDRDDLGTFIKEAKLLLLGQGKKSLVVVRTTYLGNTVPMVESISLTTEQASTSRLQCKEI
ncbi:hypothetical protein BDQ12DRAFT_735828 [Crucibulum laeve]|uniref:F-box domain-containing protein n=1 Tax=Crucibulum laeve TaxID=68775 RepID=A0A5C3MAT8_9AGAR|nr:hypothetical protein BDQ12DRAFT_735828 [Crucibulum laeve]